MVPRFWRVPSGIHPKGVYQVLDAYDQWTHTINVASYLPNDYGIQLFFMKDLRTHSLLVVPQKQMQDFIFVMDIDPDGVSFDNEPLEVGEKVQVVKGEFAGIEGELVSVANRSYVIIRIPQVLSVSVRIPKSYLKKIPLK